MTRQEYEQKRAECWEELKRTHLDGEVQWQPVNRYDVFCAAFDRAYALGKQEKDAEGRHNLTFDAEGEEILTCEKSKAMQLYPHLLDLVENERISEHYSEWCDLEREYIALFGENVFADYFGSKCLPDAREVNFATKKPQPAEQSMTDSETEHTKDEFATRMQGKFTEQDLTEAKQRTESCMASIPQFELPKQIEAQINKAMESIKAESRKQFGDFGAANADIAIPVYRQMMRLGALLALSAGYLESEHTDSDRGDYISTTKPTGPNKYTIFWREEADSK